MSDVNRSARRAGAGGRAGQARWKGPSQTTDADAAGRDLIDAFEQDQRVDRYQTFAELREYCRRSADPVGRLVLYLCGYRDDRRQRLSDQTFTGLQLANFWQDVSRDPADRDRIHRPAETMGPFGVTEDPLRAGRCDDGYRADRSVPPRGLTGDERRAVQLLIVCVAVRGYRAAPCFRQAIAQDLVDDRRSIDE